MQHLKLGKLKLGIHKIGCSMSWQYKYLWQSSINDFCIFSGFFIPPLPCRDVGSFLVPYASAPRCIVPISQKINPLITSLEYSVKIGSLYFTIQNIYRLDVVQDFFFQVGHETTYLCIRPNMHFFSLYQTYQYDWQLCSSKISKFRFSKLFF